MTDKEELYSWYFDVLRFGFSYNKDEVYKNAKGIKVITGGNYEYSIFNICFLNDMLSQVLQVIYEGYVPQIKRILSCDEYCDWDDYFYQPFYEYDLSKFTKEDIILSKGRIQTVWGPEYKAVYIEWQRLLAMKLYRDFAIIKDNEFRYITNEYVNLLKGKRVLGVLARGTDFTAGRPAGHPVQPEIPTLIKDARTLLSSLNCSHIYLATEERQIEDVFKEAFPGKILTNKRHYYDDIFYERFSEDKEAKIGAAVREADDSLYNKGLEYLSSIVLLSQCTALLGGNCGGSAAAVYYSNGCYESEHLYNLGVY